MSVLHWGQTRGLDKARGPGQMSHLPYPSAVPEYVGFLVEINCALIVFAALNNSRFLVVINLDPQKVCFAL